MATENFEKKDNLKEDVPQWVTESVKAGLVKLKDDTNLTGKVNENLDDVAARTFYYQVEGDNVKYNLENVKSYLKAIKDKERSDLRDLSGAWIMAVQIALESLGYEVGKIDGIYGGSTHTGVERFQKQVGGLTVDGFPGKETITKLCEALDKPDQFAAKSESKPDGTSTAKSGSDSDKSKGSDTGAESSDVDKSTQNPEGGKADAEDTPVQPSEGSETTGLDEKYGKDLQLFIPEVQKLVKGEKISVGGGDYNIWVKDFVVGGKREGDNIIGGEIKVCAGPSEIDYVTGLSTGDLLDKDGNFDSQSFKDVLFPKVKENLESQIKAQKVMEKLKEKRKRGYSMEELVDDPKKRTNANYLRYFNEMDSKTKSVTFDDISRDEDYINFYLDNDGRNNKPYNKLRVKYTELADGNGNFDENRLIIYLKKKIKEIVETNFGS